MLSRRVLLLRVGPQLDVLPLRGIAQLAHHVRDVVRGDANASQLATTARSHMVVKSEALWSIA